MGYSPRIEDFFELDSSKGVLRSRFDKARVFIISAVSFRIIQDGLYEAFSSGASTILHQMGMSYGQALAHRRIPGESRIRVLADLQILASVAGWGNISLIGDPTSDKKSRLIVKDCVFCTASSPHDGSQCYFLVGIVQGLLNELFQQRIKASEVKCTCKGDEFCEILLQRIA